MQDTRATVTLLLCSSVTEHIHIRHRGSEGMATGLRRRRHNTTKNQFEVSRGAWHVQKDYTPTMTKCNTWHTPTNTRKTHDTRHLHPAIILYRNGTLDRGLNTQHGCVCLQGRRRSTSFCPYFEIIFFREKYVVDIVPSCSLFLEQRNKELCHKSQGLDVTSCFYSTLFHSFR